MSGQDGAREAQWAKWRSVADLYHSFFTGLILTVVSRRGTYAKASAACVEEYMKSRW